MRITAVDHYQDLFEVSDVFPQHIVDHIMSTDWLAAPWSRQSGQETWARRRIDDSVLSWLPQWEKYFDTLLPQIEQAMNRTLTGYRGTAWWVDEPGFTCSMHTDGQMPGAMQIAWIGAAEDLGTCFYHQRDKNTLRHRFQCQPNTGYIMINTPNSQGEHRPQWHAMLNAVPPGTFRLTSYSWLSEYRHDT